MVVKNIKWDVDYDDLLATAEENGIDTDDWDEDVIEDYELVAKIMDLPTEVEIPFDVDIDDYLSDEYGYCHNGYEV